MFANVKLILYICTMKYKLYYLFDPRTDKICYVGITSQEFKRRLNQHKNPSKNNKTKIAKLQRYLLKNKLTLYGSIIFESNDESVIQQLEINKIKYFGKSNLKNIEDGGYLSPRSTESALKAVKTRRKNGYNAAKGENNGSSIFTEKQILNIYKLIKGYYTNIEIIKKLNLNVTNTTIQSIRTGQNWNWLWAKHFNLKIPSFYMSKNGINPRIKLDILKDIINNKSNKEIINKHYNQYNGIKTDIYKIRNKKCWNKLWDYIAALDGNI